jgi:hypothetical protein
MSTASSGKSVSLLYGLLYGGVSVVFTVILYLGGVKWFLNPVAYLGYVIPIAFAVLAASHQKKLQGGYIEFSEALKTIFQVLVTGSLISVVFDWVLFNYIDVPFRQALMQESAVKIEKMLEKLKMPQDQIDKAVDDMLNSNNYTIGKLLLGFAFRCIGLFILALIVAAIMKKKRPVFENTFNQ